MASPILRPAEVRDLPFILRTERHYMSEIEPGHLDGWTAALDRNLALWIDNLGHTTMVADDAENVGYAMWMPEGAEATLMGVHVLPGFRRRGLGALLLDAFAEGAHGNGAQTLKLGVHRDNPARQLYERAGYRQVGTDGDYLLYQRETRSRPPRP